MPHHYGLVESHQHVNPCNAKLQIAALDPPNAAGASSVYQITGFDTGTHPIYDSTRRGQVNPLDADCDRCTIIFQNGNPNDSAIGNNGVTGEALIALLADRYAAFQRGPFACAANARVVEHLNVCLRILAERSQERIARNVEGQQTK